MLSGRSAKHNKEANAAAIEDVRQKRAKERSNSGWLEETGAAAASTMESWVLRATWSITP